MTISTDVDKLYDTDLTDAAWALIAPMLPAARPGGRPRKINIRGCVERNLLSTANRLPMAFASPRVSRVEHGLSLLPSLEERWCLDLYPALNVPASSRASRPGRLSLSRHYGRSVGKDHRTRRHSRIRCAQARERPPIEQGLRVLRLRALRHSSKSPQHALCSIASLRHEPF